MLRKGPTGQDQRALGSRPIDMSRSKFNSKPNGSERPMSRSTSRMTTLGAQFGKVSTTSSLSSSARLTSSRNLDLQKHLDIPRTNSSKTQEKLIAEAIANITKLPEKIEQVVSRKVVEPRFQKSLLDKATRTLNIPKAGRVYHDLLDIEAIPSIQVKRAPVHEPKPVDPSPLLTDYIKPQCIRIPPLSSFPLPLTSKKSRLPNLINLDAHFNPNDLLQYERTFSSI